VKYFAVVGERQYEIEIDGDQIFVDGDQVEVDLRQIAEPELYSMLYDGHSYELVVEATRYNYTVLIRGDQYQIMVEDERTRRLNASRRQNELPDGEFAIKAPIPGLVVKLLVAEGDSVDENQPLLILEAMKMENEIRSPRACTIKKVEIAVGQRIEQNAVMIVTE
jgi:biotin carboxyl carrier protein